jgi:hypothetical protein
LSSAELPSPTSTIWPSSRWLFFLKCSCLSNYLKCRNVVHSIKIHNYNVTCLQHRPCKRTYNYCLWYISLRLSVPQTVYHQMVKWLVNNDSHIICNRVFKAYFIFVGCILLRYLHILYKHTPQKLYICDPQLTTYLLFQNLTTCFEDSHSTATHPSSLQVWGYILLLNLHVYNAKEV